MNPKRTNYRRSGTDPLWALGAPLVYNRSLRADSGRVAFFSMKKTLDWLMMVEGLPLGLLMQCYHTLAIFLSDGVGGLSFRSLSYCHLFFSSSLQSLFNSVPELHDLSK